MKKILIGVAVVVVVLVAAFFAFNAYIYNEKQGPGGAQPGYTEVPYTIDGDQVMIREGGVEYFGNTAEGDLNNDGVSDIAFLVTQSGGGSGTFYYAVVALKTDTGYAGTNAVFLGDRIAPQTTEYRDGGVIVNYADRAAGESMTARPSVGKSIFLKMVRGELVQVEKDFEGEADPDRMSLDMHTWTWIRTGTVLPKQPLAFTLEFIPTEMRFSATTDCNRVGGSYDEEGDNGLVFKDMISTKMYCEGSQESLFTGNLASARTYHFTSRGELIILLATGAEMTFR